MYDVPVSVFLPLSLNWGGVACAMTYDGASHKRKIQQEYKLILKCLAGQRAMTLFILSLLLAAYGLVCYEAGWHHKGKQVEDIVLNSQASSASLLYRTVLLLQAPQTR